jgi:hypothetical protein
MGNWILKFSSNEKEWKVHVYTSDDSGMGSEQTVKIIAEDPDEAILIYLKEYWDEHNLDYYAGSFCSYTDSDRYSYYDLLRNVFIENGELDTGETASGFQLRIWIEKNS